MEVLGEGSFGCVVKPSAPCKSDRKRVAKGKSEVGKIFVSKEDFAQELSAAKTVAKIDPKGETILVPTEHCETNLDTINDATLTWKCEAFQDHIRSPEQRLYQLLMPYGGVRLDEYTKVEQPTYQELIKILLPVAVGIVNLEKHKYCHQDIKASNILVTPQHRAIIIDYSLMIPMKDVYRPKNAHYLHHTYLSYPPEYKAVYYKKFDKELIVREILKNVSAYDEKFIKRFKKAWSKRNNWIYNKNIEKFANKVDVYSFGTVLVRLTPYLKPSPRKVKDAFERLIDTMIEIDPSKRATPSEVVKAMKNIIDM